VMTRRESISAYLELTIKVRVRVSAQISFKITIKVSFRVTLTSTPLHPLHLYTKSLTRTSNLNL
jgi:hypothetical protein